MRPIPIPPSCLRLLGLLALSCVAYKLQTNVDSPPPPPTPGLPRCRVKQQFFFFFLWNGFTRVDFFFPSSFPARSPVDFILFFRAGGSQCSSRAGDGPVPYEPALFRDAGVPSPRADVDASVFLQNRSVGSSQGGGWFGCVIHHPCVMLRSRAYATDPQTRLSEGLPWFSWHFLSCKLISCIFFYFLCVAVLLYRSQLTGLRVLHELDLDDAEDPRETTLYRLSFSPGLERFR